MSKDEPLTDEQQQLVRSSVIETLQTLGLDVSDPKSVIEAQKDMHFIRDLRRTTDSMKTKMILSIFGIILSALAAAIWLGTKASMGD